MLGGSTAAAQQVRGYTPDTRLRVTVSTPVNQVRSGFFAEISDSTLVLVERDVRVSIPLSAISRLERHAGQRPSVAGVVAGFVVGLAAGGAVGCALNNDSYGVFCGGQNDTKVFVAAGIGGAAGAALGGLLFRRDRWTAIDLSQLRR